MVELLEVIMLGDLTNVGIWREEARMMRRVKRHVDLVGIRGATCYGGLNGA